VLPGFENADGDGSNIYLSDDGKSKIHSSLTIWTAGIKGYDIVCSIISNSVFEQ
jgi:NADH dehydrogenase FAD-containing subunit